MSDGKEIQFKTPKEKDAEEMVQRIEDCEKEIQGVLGKWRMRLTVVEVRQDGKMMALEVKAVPVTGGPTDASGVDGGN